MQKGTITAAGNAVNDGERFVALVRYKSNGRLDGRFGRDGIERIRRGSELVTNEMAADWCRQRCLCRLRAAGGTGSYWRLCNPPKASRDLLPAPAPPLTEVYTDGEVTGSAGQLERERSR